MFDRFIDSVWGPASSLIAAPIRRRRWVDLLVLAALAGIVLGLVMVARQWTAVQRPVVEIDLSPWALPKYALLSFVRAGVAYVISFGITLALATGLPRTPGPSASSSPSSTSCRAYRSWPSCPWCCWPW